jgi:glycosyltransferase involved in cell wall biosynthesis
MRILFVTSHPHLPQLFGGLQTSTDQLGKGLMARGHHVAILSGLMPKGYLALKSRIAMQVNQRLSGCKVAKDRSLGYTTWRTWFPWEATAYVAREEKADLIVVMSGNAVRIALATKAANIPLLIQLQNVEFQLDGGRFEELSDIPCIANSRFTADKYRNTYGFQSTVIYPFMSLSEYRTKTSRENVTFINPHPQKGRDIALEIAKRCPEIPFAFVEAWPLEGNLKRELLQKLASLPNVTLLPAQKDMRNLYGKCKILLVPSIWEEAYGRVAPEAQISGIPVVASARGGLPEAVGPGGVLVDPDGPIQAWVNAVQKLWQDKPYYAELSAAALAYAERPELGITHQMDAYERALQAACNKK